MLTNLVTNALRHDRGGGVCVRVAPVQDAAGQTILRFEVTDHGPGLPEAEAEALFRPFHEIRPRNTAGGGAGLGLAISHELVRGMHGRIGFENTGTGARVWFEIPFTVRTAGGTPEIPAAPEAVPSGRRCLLVDDDPIGSMISAHHLTRIGYLTDHAATMAEARAAAAAASYDALVVDYLLPDGTGPELVRTLQAEQLCASARIVGLTANVEALNASSQLSAAFDVILAKPADGATLAQALLPFARRRARSPAPAEVRQPGLEGLSAETVAEMAAAFALQWEEFRARIQTLAGPTSRQGLGDLAHRLAGSSAQLGLSELVQPLRELELRCAAGETDLQDLVRLLDHPVTDCASWASLSAGRDRP